MFDLSIDDMREELVQLYDSSVYDWSDERVEEEHEVLQSCETDLTEYNFEEDDIYQ